MCKEQTFDFNKEYRFSAYKYAQAMSICKPAHYKPIDLDDSTKWYNRVDGELVVVETPTRGYVIDDSINPPIRFLISPHWVEEVEENV